MPYFEAIVKPNCQTWARTMIDSWFVQRYKKAKKALLFIKQLGFWYFVHLTCAPLVVPILMNVLSIYMVVYRRYANFLQWLNLEKGFRYWKLRKEEVLRVGEKGYHLCVDGLGLSCGALKKVQESLRSAPGVIIADIDQDGLLLSHVGPIDFAPAVLSKERFMKRGRFTLRLIAHRKGAAVKKEYNQDKRAFLNELRALHMLALAGCNVPSIFDVNFDELSITISYIAGINLQEQLAQKGALIRDYDIQTNDELMALSSKERYAGYIQEGKRVVADVVEPKFIEALFVELKKIHRAGFELYDIKYGNVIIEKKSGMPFLVDFDSARCYPRLGKMAFSVIRDRDIEKFNLCFNGRKHTYKRIGQKIRNGTFPMADKLYAPVYFGYGLKIGNVFDMNVGYGRWHYILKENLPSLSGKRILSLGANNAFNEMQMLRHGAREVVGIEVNDEYIAQGTFIKEAMEWADNNLYNFIYVPTDMAKLPEIDLGEFDMVIALCSLYYLEDAAVSRLVRHISRITDMLVLQCNVREDIGRPDPHMYERASIDYSLRVLYDNGFSDTKVIAPAEYSRPLIIGKEK